MTRNVFNQSTSSGHRGAGRAIIGGKPADLGNFAAFAGGQPTHAFNPTTRAPARGTMPFAFDNKFEP